MWNMLSQEQQRSYSDALKAYWASLARHRDATVAYESRYGQLSGGSNVRVQHADTYAKAMLQDPKDPGEKAPQAPKAPKDVKIPETAAELHHARIAAQPGASDFEASFHKARASLKDEQERIQEQERLKTAAFSYTSSDEGMM